MKTTTLIIEYWDPKIHKVFQGPYLRKHLYVNEKKLRKYDPIIL